jgi:Fe-S cluster assembly protein SufD
MAPETHVSVPAPALEAWHALGLPTTRSEDWRYFPVRALDGLDLAPTPTRATRLAVRVGPVDLALLDGRLVAALAADHPLARQVIFDTAPARAPLGLGWESGLEAANAAFQAGELTIHLGAGEVAERPLSVAVDATEGSVAHPRIRVALGAGSRLRLVLSLDDAGARLHNLVVAVALGADARLELVIAASGAAGGLAVALVDGSIGRGARLEAFTASTRIAAAEQAGATRVAFRIHLDGEGAEARVDGLYLPSGSARLDHLVDVDHRAPRTRSEATWAGAVDDRASGTWLGRVRIGADVRGCTTRQLTRSLLLSPHASAQAKPELRIDCDDVTASHGATTGSLDPRQAFYLTSRGLSPDAARRLLVAASLREALGRAPAFARAALEAMLGLAPTADPTQPGADDDAAEP